ncbi:hypothetical protein [Amycolatopsis sp. PS_44_ISF1]|uniref:hypothetical protein n=1 Tax=Amycolatopsis sp. PS_44_ISF1 TaxID=2974917 RepID=UPI0028DEF567|nr:hypothetical protein [Amycolatopsis sp. PS_44_ISF1]MDT8913169.1 hypothetical protein [Amycolatopsis sp. PS_44_ISF1]
MDAPDPAGPGRRVLGRLTLRLQDGGGPLHGVQVRARVREDGQVWLSWLGGPSADAVATELLSFQDKDFPVEPVPSAHRRQARLRVAGVLVVLDAPDRARPGTGDRGRA